MAEARKGAGRPQGAPAQPGLGGEAPKNRPEDGLPCGRPAPCRNPDFGLQSRRRRGRMSVEETQLCARRKTHGQFAAAVPPGGFPAFTGG